MCASKYNSLFFHSSITCDLSHVSEGGEGPTTKYKAQDISLKLPVLKNSKEKEAQDVSLMLPVLKNSKERGICSKLKNLMWVLLREREREHKVAAEDLNP